eukprot:TRINITY_DN5423_c0_g1_i2.p1 TRINITY_DN5423_c0_g1~~TRINITY_DN5423_c0_g1_i2.p1  ORF type:complete len:182 (-),score=27.06 TRINITY_DN5423_c0_g1_i2:38-538(-)
MIRIRQPTTQCLRRFASNVSVPKGTVRVVDRGTGNFTNDVYTANHHFVVDEPAKMGGDDLGPAPYELLLSSLGACTSMMIRLYARQNSVPLDSVEVTLKHGRKRAQDLGDRAVKQSGHVDVFNVDVQLHGDQLTTEHKAALMKIANSCPVHQTLNNEILVDVHQVL